jgi:hypothetical protein
VGLQGNEKDEDICMAAADIKLFASKISNVKEKACLGEAKIEKTENINSHVSALLQDTIMSCTRCMVNWTWLGRQK